MRSTQSKCSGFMSTERRQVIVSRSRLVAPRFSSQKRIGNSATARCRSRLAAASNILRLKTEASLTLVAFGANTTMSSSGEKAVTNRASARSFPKSASAAFLPRSNPRANSPPFFSGSNLCVAHKARRSRPRTGALQAYLAQVQFGRAEISVGRIMLVHSAHSGIAKEYAAAPVGLQSVLVRIDDNRVRFSNPCNGPFRIFSKILRKHEIAAVRRIGMNPESMLCAQIENLRQRIHRTCCRGAHRRDNRPHVAAPHALCQRTHVHSATRIARRTFEWQLQNTADPPVRIVSLFAGEYFFPGCNWPATHKASRFAIVPPPHRWPRKFFHPNMPAISATASFSIAEVARPPSSA